MSTTIVLAASIQPCAREPGSKRAGTRHAASCVLSYVYCLLLLSRS